MKPPDIMLLSVLEDRATLIDFSAQPSRSATTSSRCRDNIASIRIRWSLMNVWIVLVSEPLWLRWLAVMYSTIPWRQHLFMKSILGRMKKHCKGSLLHACVIPMQAALNRHCNIWKGSFQMPFASAMPSELIVTLSLSHFQLKWNSLLQCNWSLRLTIVSWQLFYDTMFDIPLQLGHSRFGRTSQSF